MKPKNIKAFKALIKKYESIELKDIPELTPLNERNVKSTLTGFGFTSTCTLCKAVDKVCGDCVFYVENVFFPCSHSKVHSKTYIAIDNAVFKEELLQAYRARAEHMKQVLKSLSKPTNGINGYYEVIDETKNPNQNNHV